MADIRLRGKYYYYDFMIDGVRYKGTTKTTDKKLAEKIASTIKTDIIRKKHSLPSAINYRFEDVWEQYLKNLNNAERTIKVKKWISIHFLPVFKDKNIADIAQLNIKEYQLKRKLEIMAMPKNAGKRESEILFA